MRLNQAALLTLVIALPVSVEVPNSDSTRGPGETRVSLTGSVGRYALIDRGCEGQVLRTHPHDYSEAGLEAVHTLDNGVSMGVRAGVIHENVTHRYQVASDTVLAVKTEWDNTYVNPSIGYEGVRGGIGVGAIMASKPFVMGPEEPFATDYRGNVTRWNSQKVLPSFHLRAGRLDGRYLRIAFMESAPLYSGGGYFDLGLGSHLSRRWDLYAGLSAGPFDSPGLALRTEYRALPNLAINAKTRLGRGGGENQSGVALGVTWVSRPPAAPHYVESSSEYRSRMWKPEADTLKK